MADETTVSTTAASDTRKPRDWTVPAKWAAGAVVGITILTMEWLGKAPAGTWLNVFAVPVLIFIGLDNRGAPRPSSPPSV